MAFASYINPERGDRSAVLGQFQEKEHRNWFEYTNRNSIDKDNFSPEYPHRIFVGEDINTDDTRVARVLKTVAYVIVDIDMNGDPVVEKWSIHGHSKYNV